MSRELLERVISGDDAGDFFIGYRLYKDIETFLDQPEQEPKFNFDLERMKAAIESPISDVTVDNLAKQVKQEPLSDKQITKLWRIEVELSYLEIEYDEFAGIVRAIEKAHGIGGGE